MEITKDNYLSKLFINEAKPALKRHAGGGGSATLKKLVATKNGTYDPKSAIRIEVGAEISFKEVITEADFPEGFFDTEFGDMDLWIDNDFCMVQWESPVGFIIQYAPSIASDDYYVYASSAEIIKAMTGMDAAPGWYFISGNKINSASAQSVIVTDKKFDVMSQLPGMFVTEEPADGYNEVIVDITGGGPSLEWKKYVAGVFYAFADNGSTLYIVGNGNSELPSIGTYQIPPWLVEAESNGYTITRAFISGITDIGDYGLRLKDDTLVVISDQLMSVGRGAIPNRPRIFDVPAGLEAVANNNEIYTSIGIVNLKKWCESGISKQLKYLLEGGSIPHSYKLSTYSAGTNKSFHVDSDITIISDEAFAKWSGIGSLWLQGDIKSVGSCAFASSSDIISIYFTKCTSVPTLANVNAFSNLPEGARIRVPSALYDEWITATNWCDLEYEIVGV